MKESDYIQKYIIEHLDYMAEVDEISHEKLLPKISVFMFHHTFYPKPKVDLEYAIMFQGAE